MPRLNLSELPFAPSLLLCDEQTLLGRGRGRGRAGDWNFLIEEKSYLSQ